ncbi:15-hydroxyprostaglandin dehydrogenase [NAD(+)] [Leptinotarsa decemlineata]|uniref:15-hydroxyprostaglandin dehydrogenase [NAD(+)] n=1 Tax=Leptinotarsa decemlineata TaxID=7539 RepID=UPI000C25299D|nr:15-hydroxyprostaglandin dehydrogenase [NAD(+)]-like [Leptinotarsa decemlineata]
MAAFRNQQFYKLLRPMVTIRRTNALQAKNKNSPTKVNIEDKVAVITGGASGIGFEIAKEFLKAGMSALTIIDNDKKKSEESLKILSDEFGEEKILLVEADVADTDQMDAALRNAVLHYQTIDIIVNNAGILDDTKWEQELRTNLRGCVIGTLLGMQYMAKSSSGEGGTIVNIGSIMSIIPSCGFPIYTMTQFGIAGFSKALGSSNLYERTNVKIFGYCPGITQTNMLKDVSNKTINTNFASEFQEEIENYKIQNPQSAAKGLLEILEEAKPGSIWIAENDEPPYEMSFQPVFNRKKNKAAEEMGS